MTGTASNWIRVSKRRPCPICGKPDWCTVSADGAAAICPRTVSARWVGSNGGGYLHKVDGSPARTPVPATRTFVAASASPDLVGLMRNYRTAVNPQRLERLAVSLGVSARSLDRLGVGWAHDRDAWAFPMMDARGSLQGVRLRWADGRKRSVTGGHEGLFVPADLAGEGPFLICEGPTSLAALLDLGFDGAGRPSCTGGAGHVLELLASVPKRRLVVVLGDNDEPKARPDGSTFRPGQEGARRLAAEIAATRRDVKVLVPPAKDARDWLRAGATRALVEAVIRNQRFVTPAPAAAPDNGTNGFITNRLPQSKSRRSKTGPEIHGGPAVAGAPNGGAGDTRRPGPTLTTSRDGHTNPGNASLRPGADDDAV